ncbi:MFS transporter [Microbacteriaceae bacterium 4G12]
MSKTTYTFWTMIGIVAISGLSQGMLLPAIAMIFEKEGVSSSLNGFHATALYMGILLISPFLEKPMQRFGMKPIILFGTSLVVVAIFFFTQTFSFWIWFVLRFFVGIGDHMLHVGTQTWITTTSDPRKIGRNVSIYGAFFSIGFAIGPSLASTVQYGLATPFIISTVLCCLSWLFILPIQNTFPEQAKENKLESSVTRYKKVLTLSWIALLGPFVYGLLEGMLNSNFPVYAIRKGLSIQEISFLLPAFAIGGIITQVPLGMLSDRYGRARVLTWVFIGGAATFFLTGLVDQHYWLLFVMVFVSGMIVGSSFGLGLGYMADLLPKYLLPAGNIICGIAFSFGSIIGPIFGGIFIQAMKDVSFFMSIAVLLFVVAVVYITNKKKDVEEEVPEKVGNF